MQLGSVFIWNSFPFRIEGKEKNRYFVYFGESHYPDNPVKVFLITTTSRIYHYEEEGARKSHNYCRFSAGSFGFIEDSILDLDSYYDIDKKVFEKYKEDIKEKGQLPEPILKNIYNLILKSKNISMKVKQDIHYNYNLEDISGLKNLRENNGTESNSMVYFLLNNYPKRRKREEQESLFFTKQGR